MHDTTQRSENDWKKKLTPEQYNVCRMGGTESPFSGKYDKHTADGIFYCVACSAPPLR